MAVRPSRLLVILLTWTILIAFPQSAKSQVTIRIGGCPLKFDVDDTSWVVQKIELPLRNDFFYRQGDNLVRVLAYQEDPLLRLKKDFLKGCSLRIESWVLEKGKEELIWMRFERGGEIFYMMYDELGDIKQGTELKPHKPRDMGDKVWIRFDLFEGNDLVSTRNIYLLKPKTGVPESQSLDE